MLLLSLDCASSSCAVCVWQDGVARALAEEKMQRGQDARLMPLVLDVMKKADADFAQLDRIAVTRGPGSFTGLRIGLAAARGIGLAADKPVLGVDRFRIYRERQKALQGPLLVVLQSKRLELFCRYYPASGEAEEPCMLPPGDIVALVSARAPLTLAGDATDLLRSVLPPSAAMCPASEPETVTSAALAAKAALDDPSFLPRPLYLRAPDVTFAKGSPANECCA